MLWFLLTSYTQTWCNQWYRKSGYVYNHTYFVNGLSVIVLALIWPESWRHTLLLLSSSTFASVIFRESNYRCAFSLPLKSNRPLLSLRKSVPQSLLAADKAVGLRCTTPPSLSTCAQSSGSSSNYSAIPSDLLTRLSGSSLHYSAIPFGSRFLNQVLWAIADELYPVRRVLHPFPSCPK